MWTSNDQAALEAENTRRCATCDELEHLHHPEPNFRITARNIDAVQRAMACGNFIKRADYRF